MSISFRLKKETLVNTLHTIATENIANTNGVRIITKKPILTVTVAPEFS